MQEDKKNNGAALPSVIIISAVLIMMVVSLTKISVQQLQVSKSHKNIDYTYLASASMVERTFNYINGFLSDPNNYMSLPVPITDDIQFSKDVVNLKVWPSINNKINLNPNPSAREIVVGSAATQKAEAFVDSIEWVDASVSGSNINVTIGITTKATFRSGKNVATDKAEYAEKTFTIKRPTQQGIKLAAVNGIGDLYASGYLKAMINGDVKVVGTAPKKAKQMEQYYYGGIYARDNANVIINGSAFCRSFIRTGGYGEGTDDYGKIRIKNSAVAQGIHVFGNSNKLFVYGDAFTFDDLEMNGVNSVIGINRNYFGLSHGDQTGTSGSYHDASSGVVNSSVVHNPDLASIDLAKKSKIIINGDVFINGGTFWVNPATGDILYPNAPQIEDASSAWSNIEDLPTYKLFDGSLGGLYHIESGDRSTDWILNKSKTPDMAIGYGNIFQAWTPRTIDKNMVSDDSNPIVTWFENEAKKAMDLGFAGVPAAADDVQKISGFCTYEMAANGKMYFMYNQSHDVPIGYLGTQEDLSEIERAKHVLDSKEDYDNALYYLGNAKTSAPDWNSKWSELLDTSCSWDRYSDGVSPHIAGTVNLLKEIKDTLVKTTEDFVERVYNWSLTNSYITNKTRLAPDGSTVSMFDYIGNELAAINTSVNAYVITDTEISSIPTFPKNIDGNYLISDYINSNPATKDNYYIIVNLDPTMTLEINSKMNGIIYTRGKIVLSAGAEVHGFILAAGRGCNSVGDLDGSAAEDGKMPFILADGSNQANLDNGLYAAIEFKGSNNPADASKTAIIDFSDPTSIDDPFNPEKALDYLMNRFNVQDASGVIYNALYKLFK
jgi:hypothetical protein